MNKLSNQAISYAVKEFLASCVNAYDSRPGARPSGPVATADNVDFVRSNHLRKAVKWALESGRLSPMGATQAKIFLSASKK